MKKKAVAAMTMQVVSMAGEKREVRVWNGFCCREGGFGCLLKGGLFEEDVALVGGGLNDGGGRNCGGGSERKEMEGDKVDGNDGRL
jgi:hypothetical protein